LNTNHTIVLGCYGPFIAAASKHLWAHANDAPFTDWNNNRSLALTLH
jgi:hypothetical protein